MEQLPQDTARQILASRQQFQTATSTLSKPLQFNIGQLTTQSSLSPGGAVLAQQQRAAAEIQRQQALQQVKEQAAEFELGAKAYEGQVAAQQAAMASSSKEASDWALAQKLIDRNKEYAAAGDSSVMSKIRYIKAHGPQGVAQAMATQMIREKFTPAAVTAALKATMYGGKSLAESVGLKAEPKVEGPAPEKVFIAGTGWTTRPGTTLVSEGSYDLFLQRIKEGEMASKTLMSLGAQARERPLAEIQELMKKSQEGRQFEQMIKTYNILPSIETGIEKKITVIPETRITIGAEPAKVSKEDLTGIKLTQVTDPYKLWQMAPTTLPYEQWARQQGYIQSKGFLGGAFGGGGAEWTGLKQDISKVQFGKPVTYTDQFGITKTELKFKSPTDQASWEKLVKERGYSREFGRSGVANVPGEGFKFVGDFETESLVKPGTTGTLVGMAPSFTGGGPGADYLYLHPEEAPGVKRILKEIQEGKVPDVKPGVVDNLIAVIGQYPRVYSTTLIEPHTEETAQELLSLQFLNPKLQYQAAYEVNLQSKILPAYNALINYVNKQRNEQELIANDMAKIRSKQDAENVRIENLGKRYSKGEITYDQYQKYYSDYKNDFNSITGQFNELKTKFDSKESEANKVLERPEIKEIQTLVKERGELTTGYKVLEARPMPELGKQIGVGALAFSESLLLVSPGSRILAAPTLIYRGGKEIAAGELGPGVLKVALGASILSGPILGATQTYFPKTYQSFVSLPAVSTLQTALLKPTPQTFIKWGGYGLTTLYSGTQAIQAYGQTGKIGYAAAAGLGSLGGMYVGAKEAEITTSIKDWYRTRGLKEIPLAKPTELGGPEGFLRREPGEEFDRMIYMERAKPFSIKKPETWWTSIKPRFTEQGQLVFGYKPGQFIERQYKLIPDEVYLKYTVGKGEAFPYAAPEEHYSWFAGRGSQEYYLPKTIGGKELPIAPTTYRTVTFTATGDVPRTPTGQIQYEIWEPGLYTSGKGISIRFARTSPVEKKYDIFGGDFQLKGKDPFVYTFYGRPSNIRINPAAYEQKIVNPVTKEGIVKTYREAFKYTPKEGVFEIPLAKREVEAQLFGGMEPIRENVAYFKFGGRRILLGEYVPTTTEAARVAQISTRPEFQGGGKEKVFTIVPLGKKAELSPFAEEALSKLRSPEERLKIIEEAFKNIPTTKSIPETPKTITENLKDLFKVPSGKQGALVPTLESLRPVSQITIIKTPLPGSVQATKLLTRPELKTVTLLAGAGGTSDVTAVFQVNPVPFAGEVTSSLIRELPQKKVELSLSPLLVEKSSLVGELPGPSKPPVPVPPSDGGGGGGRSGGGAPPSEPYIPPDIPPTPPPYYPPTDIEPPSRPAYPVYPIEVPYKSPSPRLFEIPRPITARPFAKPKIKKRITGYEVEIRRRKKFREAAPFAFPTKEEAIAFGARRVLQTAAATFRVKPSEKPIREVQVAPLPVGKYFRPPKKPAVDTYVQKKTLRITTPGEKREISLVGAAARRGTRRTSTSFLKSKRTTKSKGIFQIK